MCLQLFPILESHPSGLLANEYNKEEKELAIIITVSAMVYYCGCVTIYVCI